MKLRFFQKIIDVLRGKLFFNFIGKNNQILIPDVSNFNFLKLFALSKFKINGNNNTIIFRGNFSKINFFNICKELVIYIYGDNNIVDIELPVQFENVLIGMENNDNSFKIKSTNYLIREAKIFVEEGGSVSIGKSSQLTNRNLYIAVNDGYKNPPKLIIGDNVYIAKDVIIRTSDGHSMLDPISKIAINEPEDVIIGNNVWITSRCTILKGSRIPNNSVVAACSLVNKKFTEDNVLIAGSPAKVIKKNILWDYRTYNEYMKDYENARN